eukprot:191944-Pelagomonas_calceolata.AAC.1
MDPMQIDFAVLMRGGLGDTLAEHCRGQGYERLSEPLLKNGQTQCATEGRPPNTHPPPDHKGYKVFGPPIIKMLKKSQVEQRFQSRTILLPPAHTIMHYAADTTPH